MSRVLIVGSEGQIGTQLSKALSNRDDFDDLFLCDIKDKSRTDLNYFKVDALSYDDLKSFIIDKETRHKSWCKKESRTSDHAPVRVELCL